MPKKTPISYKTVRVDVQLDTDTASRLSLVKSLILYTERACRLQLPYLPRVSPFQLSPFFKEGKEEIMKTLLMESQGLPEYEAPLWPPARPEGVRGRDLIVYKPWVDAGFIQTYMNPTETRSPNPDTGEWLLSAQLGPRFYFHGVVYIPMVGYGQYFYPHEENPLPSLTFSHFTLIISKEGFLSIDVSFKE